MNAEQVQCDADFALVRRILDGDLDAVRALSSRLACVPRVLRIQNARAGGLLDEHELSDVAQDVFLILWRKLRQFDGGSVLPAWAYRIALLEYQNAMRSKLRRWRESDLGARGEETPQERPGDPWEYEDLHDGLARIGREEARVIRLKHFGARTFAEISAQLACPESTIKDRYYRGIAELRTLLVERRE